MARVRRVWPRVRRALSLVLVNLGIFVGLVVITNIVSAALLALSRNETVTHEVHDVLGIGVASWASQAKLPPYAGHERKAKAVLEELERSLDVEYTPYVEWKRRSFAGKWVTVSASGDRVYRTRITPPSSAPVIRFFGGSTMWGAGVEDSETIPAVYTRLHPRYRVHNHGGVALISRQNLERLINLLTQRQRTDVAVFYEGVNDALTLCRPDIDLNGHGEEVAMREILSNKDSLGELFYGRTLQLLRKITGSRSKEFACGRSPDRARRVAETVLNVWKLARAIQAEGCGRLIVVLQPVAFIGRPRVDYLDLEKDIEFGKGLRAVYRYWQAAAKRPENPWLHDLTGTFDGDRPLYVDFVHVAQAGNETMARRIGPLVERALADARRDSHCRTRS